MMKQYKKIMILMVVMAVFMCGCGAQEEEAQVTHSSENMENSEKSENNGSNEQVGEAQRETTGKSVVGMITEVFGNEITIQVGSMAAGNQGGMQNGAGMSDRQEGEMPEGEMPTGEMPEGEMPTGEMSANRGQGNMTSGEGMSEEMMEEMQGMREQSGGNASGGMGASGMGSNMMMGTETEDMSELIELTDETATYIIPVGTVVNQFGTEMTFSQLTEDMYITITMDEDDVILSINVLG